MQPPWKAIWSLLKILKIELLHGQAVPLHGIYQKKKKEQKTHPTLFHKYLFITMPIAALFIIAKTWKRPICLLTDEQRKKILYI